MSEKINYLVNIIFNDRGIKLTGKKTCTLAVYSEPENLEAYIHESVPPQLILSWEPQHDLRFLSGGDLCVVYNEEEQIRCYGVVKKFDPDEPGDIRDGITAYVFHYRDLIHFKRESGIGSWYKVKYKIRPLEEEEEEEAINEYERERLRLIGDIENGLSGKNIDCLLKIKHIIKKV